MYLQYIYLRQNIKLKLDIKCPDIVNPAFDGKSQKHSRIILIGGWDLHI